MKQWIQWGSILVLWVVLPNLAAAAGPGEIRKVEVLPSSGEILIEITVSSPVTPAVEAAQNPDRLVLKLPDTISDSRQKHIAVEKFGVRSVRYGLNQSTPPETHLVVDLDQERTYRLSTEGNKILLLIEPAAAATAKRREPASAARAPLLGMGRAPGANNGTPGSQADSSAVLLPPPPEQPPIVFSPEANSQASANGAAASSSSAQPSAQHPNRASLQEGTVFPSAGAPGAGVPPSSRTNSAGDAGGSTTAATNTQSSAAANAEPVAAQKALPQEPPQVNANATPEPATSVRPDGASSLPSSSGQNVAVASQPQIQAALPTQQAVSIKPALPPSAANQASPAEASPQHERAQELPENTEASGSGHGQALQLPIRQGENPDLRTAFRVKYVAEDAAYLEGGRSSGLTEGMKLVVRDLPNVGAVAAVGSDSNAAGDVAELEVLSVAETSAVTEIHSPKRPVKVGDLAYLSSADQEALIEKNALSATRKYPAVVSFTENDTLDDEARAEVPKPPLPSVNRARARIGFDYIGVRDGTGSGMLSSNVGMVVQADITRLNGTYWNVRGYWRGRFDHTTAGPQTLQDTINRTYHLYTDYTNPNSAWVAGFGRLYLPWATSLDTIDGGYFGRKVATGVTTGLFLGSTPDPTSYSYDPNAEIGGAFVNFQGGSFDDFHYSSTEGGGVGMQKWSVNRPFVFAENTIFYKRIFSIYQASQIDSRQGYWYKDPTTNTNVWQPGANWGLGRSFTTVRFQPHPRIELDANQTYFRDLPTFDPTLIGTGLLDKFLMQGFSAGGRVNVWRQIWLMTDLGMSNRTGDKKNSLNQMYGVTVGRLPWIGLHADARYTRFNSSFGSGSYEALSFSRTMGERFQLQALLGQQNFSSSLTTANRSRFLNLMVETALGQHYFVQGGTTINRGQMNYDQWIFTFGYRFDNRHGHAGE